MTDHPYPCPCCGSTATLAIPGPHPGGHHARLECASCSRFLRWLPRPAGGPLPEGLRPRLRSEGPAAPLVGTEGQVKWARVIQWDMRRHFLSVDRQDLVDLIRIVADASWFIANRDHPPDALRWPTPDQVEVSEPVPGPAGGSR